MKLYLACISQLVLFVLSVARDLQHVTSKNYFFPKYRHEAFYDRMIPEDTEVDVFLHKGQPQKLFFVLDSGFRPISVTVTPCSQVLLEWKISHSIFQNPMDGAYRPAAWSNHVMRPPSSSPSATYVGRERRSYTNPHAPPGMYTLELRSSGETRAKVVVTMRPIVQMPYHPPLPPEPGVQIIKIKRNRILISWKASLSTGNIQYCVTSNNRGNYNSLCAAESDLSTSTSYAPRRHGASLQCMGRKTWHLFKGLQRSRTYYFDVFVLDAETNASSTYVGVSATLRGGDAPPSRVKDDSLVTYTLDESNGYTVNTKYQLGKSAGPYLVFLQSCTGPGPVNVHVSQNGIPKQDIMSTTVMDVKTLELHRQMAAPQNASTFFTFTIRSTTSHPRKVRVWISGKRHALPFPVLPQDKSVRVLDTLTTCDSVTIGWKTSPDERGKYCIYRQAARDELMQRTLAEPQNFCEAPREGSTTAAARETVLCRRYHRFSKRRFNNLIMQKVKGLDPGTMYLFEVQVTKVKGKMLPYEQVWATTLDSCAHNLRNSR